MCLPRVSGLLPAIVLSKSEGQSGDGHLGLPFQGQELHNMGTGYWDIKGVWQSKHGRGCCRASTGGDIVGQGREGRALMGGGVAGQGWEGVLQGKDGRGCCRARMGGGVAGQGWEGALQGKHGRGDCRARMEHTHNSLSPPPPPPPSPQSLG